MTLTEIAYNLLNIVRGGRSNHDEHISLDQIKFNVKHYRAVFIRRDYAKNGFRSRHVEQDLGCIKVERVNASKCCGLSATDCVYRTVQPIPKTVRYNFEEAITYVGDVSGFGTIPMVESNTIKYLPYDKYTKGKYKAYMIDDYLYIYNADGLEYINIRGVFEDPEDVSKFGDCNGGGCYKGDSTPFPMPLDMIQLINQGIMGGELKLLSGTVSDTENDRMQDPQTIMRPGKQQ
jgi:hypothetical protein|tara:strand:- start:762 stop:1460 length:699 start_codon:yes stop_codon:yes gene_type:complete